MGSPKHIITGRGCPGQSLEAVFGQIKHARGCRQFPLRGIAKARAEWAMLCTAHNLLKLHKATR